jgi:hypothetical protein
MIEKPSINSFNLLVLNASYSFRLLSLSSVILSSSLTRCKYCSSYGIIVAKDYQNSRQPRPNIYTYESRFRAYYYFKFLKPGLGLGHFQKYFRTKSFTTLPFCDILQWLPYSVSFLAIFPPMFQFRSAKKEIMTDFLGLHNFVPEG